MRKVVADWTSNWDPRARYRKAASTVTKMEQEVADGAAKIFLDLRDVEFVEPFYSAPLATAIQRLSDNGVSVSLNYPSNSDAEDYLKTINFPEGCTKPTQLRKSYIPLTRFSPSSDASIIEKAGLRLNSLIRELVRDSPAISNGVYYPIGELLSNVEEHSQCKHGNATVQYFQNRDRIDICIVDDGVTIPGNYSEHNVEFDSDLEALMLAVKEGRSTKPEYYGTRRNRGTGLRTTSKLICEGLDGEMIFSSRGATVHRKGQSWAEVKDVSWNGTMVFARLRVPQDDFPYQKYITS